MMSLAVPLHPIANETHKILSRRLIISGVIMGILALLVASRYLYLQIILHDDYSTRSNENRIKLRPINPERGIIYDRNHIPLVENRPRYSLVLQSKKEAHVNLALERLNTILHLGDTKINSIRNHINQQSASAHTIPLPLNLDSEQLAKIMVERYWLPHIELKVRSMRYYPYQDVFAHILGYVSGITEQERWQLDEVNYKNTHVIGKVGIEKVYEQVLNGNVGYENEEVNALGQVLRVIDKQAPQQGKQITLHIDSRLQQFAWKLLEGKQGTIIALEPATGGILAMVSAPSFNPNPFIMGMGQEEFRALSKAENRPLFNRALQGQYSPGSIVKPVFALAALHHNVISSQTHIVDTGVFQLPNDPRRYRDWKPEGHGEKVNVYQAIVESCDVFFYQTIVNLGIERLAPFIQQFNFGIPTGIDIDSTAEAKGLVPNDAWKRQVWKQAWYAGDTVNLSIGQGFLLTTPIQIAVMTAILANRGVKPIPRIVHSIDKKVEEPQLTLIRDEIEPAHWNLVLRAMRNVVHGNKGTGRGINRHIQYTMAGKTGTVQVVSKSQDDEALGQEVKEIKQTNRDHSVFIGFAPFEQPRIAVAVIVENAGDGSKIAAPIARKILDAYLIP